MEAYWRGRVFDRYTGHGWQLSVDYDPQRFVVVGRTALGRDLREFAGNPEAEGTLLDQTFRLELVQGTTVYAAAEPVSIRTPYPHLERNALNCWDGIHRGPETTQYSVTSALPVANPDRLRKASTDYSPSTRRLFLSNAGSTDRVAELARRITAPYTNPFDKAMALERYLGEKYTYDLNAPPAPVGTDAVDHFLFSSGVGYCDVFASSMVVMCRHVGIPARLATGFLPGTYDASIRAFRVRDRDRHAWAEVYFPGCGWEQFDPTTWTVEAEESWWSRVTGNMRRTIAELFGGPTTTPITIFILLACAAVAFGPQLRETLRARRTVGPSRLHAAAVGRYLAIRRTLRIDGPHLTAIEVARSSNVPSDKARVLALEAASIFGEIRYGTREVTREDLETLSSLHRQLQTEMRRERRD